MLKWANIIYTVFMEWMDELAFYVLFNSISVISDDGQMIMKGSVLWDTVYNKKRSLPHMRLKPVMLARLEGQRFTLTELALFMVTYSSMFISQYSKGEQLL